MKSSDLKEARKALKLTQEGMADLIGVSFQTYNGYENGKTIPKTKYQILDNLISKSKDYSQSIIGNNSYMAGGAIHIQDDKDKIQELKDEITCYKKQLIEKDDIIKKLIENQQKLINKL